MGPSSQAPEDVPLCMYNMLHIASKPPGMSNVGTAGGLEKRVHHSHLDEKGRITGSAPQKKVFSPRKKNAVAIY